MLCSQATPSELGLICRSLQQPGPNKPFVSANFFFIIHPHKLPAMLLAKVLYAVQRKAIHSMTWMSDEAVNVSIEVNLTMNLYLFVAHAINLPRITRPTRR